MTCLFSLLNRLSYSRSIRLKAMLLLIVLAASSGTMQAQLKKKPDPCVTECQSNCDDVDIKQRGQCVKSCEDKCEGKTQSNPYYDPGCFDRTITGKIRCTIIQPPVNQHETPFPKLVFAPGDLVQVNADGCVQTGGVGNTWKRYVNPSAPGAGNKYHGMIRIPSGTKDSALVEIKDVVAKTITVTGQGVDPQQLFLSLGYEDDNYSDNGYNDHDDGTDDQCKSQGSSYGGPAAVTLLIFRGVPADLPQSHFDFDVVSTTNDPNGLPYKPLWTWQARPENKGQKPDTNICHNFSVRGSTLGVPDEFMSPYLGDCTDQADEGSIDQPTGFNGIWCSYWTKPFIGDVFPGHANWFPVTVEGRSNWGDHSADIVSDDDYTFNYLADDGIDGLSVNGRSGMHVEFDSDETIDNFTSDEWNQFHLAVDDWNLAKAQEVDCIKKPGSCSDQQKADISARLARPSTLWDGHTILTGMFGIDNEHEPKAELHPLYALATLRDNFENDPGDEVWLMLYATRATKGFVRAASGIPGWKTIRFACPGAPG